MRTTRRYRCPITGDGLTPDTAYRPSLPAGTDWEGEIPTDRFGRPINATTTIRASADEEGHTRIRAHPGVTEVT